MVKTLPVIIQHVKDEKRSEVIMDLGEKFMLKIKKHM